MKKFVCILLLVSLCACLCACSLPFPQERYLSPEITHPETYLITYESVTPNGNTPYLSEGIDADGNAYHKYEGVEYLYVINPEYTTLKKYDQYTNNGRGWVEGEKEVMGGAPYEMSFIYTYAKYNLKATNCTMKKNANETLAGRDCYSYSIVVHQSGSSSVTEKYTYEVLIDVETGYCLKSVCTKIDSPFDDTQTPYGFICTEFTTDPASFADLVK